MIGNSSKPACARVLPDFMTPSRITKKLKAKRLELFLQFAGI
jgi:hypothetical protein